MKRFYERKFMAAFVLWGLTTLLFPTYGQAAQKRQHDPEIVKPAKTTVDADSPRDRKFNSCSRILKSRSRRSDPHSQYGNTRRTMPFWERLWRPKSSA